MSLNKVMLIGNVGKDPEVRYLENQTQNGAKPKVATLTLATTERYTDRTGESRENTEWHTIVAWRQLADLCEKYIRKGTQIYVEGRLRTRSWDDQNGNKRYTVEIIATTIQLLGRRSDNPASQNAPAPSYAAAPAPARVQNQPEPQQQAEPVAIDILGGDDGDDLPF